MSLSETIQTRTPASGASRSSDLSIYLVRHHVAIVVLSGARRGSEYPIRAPRLVIGRSSDADLSFEDPTISRHHAAIEFRGGAFVLEDLDSANGILVDGDPIQVHELAHGERFQCGNLHFQFVLEEREPEPRTQMLPVD